MSNRYTISNVKPVIKRMLKAGTYDQHTIFNAIYPTYYGHYAPLRDLISEMKNNA